MSDSGKKTAMVPQKSYEDLLENIVRALDQERFGQGESINGVQGPSQQEESIQRKTGVGKLRQTPVKKAKKTGIGELFPQRHGGALRRGNPGNRGGGRPSHAVKEVLCGDLWVMHERILARLNDPRLSFTGLLDLYLEVEARLYRYGLWDE